MGSIRKQTILSSFFVYFGFLIGAINIYFYTKIGTQHGTFSADQFGLTRIFFDYAQNMYAFSSLGIIPIIYKFYPFYKDNLEEHEIDLMTWTMLTAGLGFILILITGFYFEPFFVQQFSDRSKLIVDYYYWIFPFALGMLFFSVVEGFCWGIQKTVISNFLKEPFLRFITLIFILLFYFKIISFDSFIKLFSFLYLIIFLILFFYLFKTKRFQFPFKISRVTKKFKKKIWSMQALIFGGTIIATIATTIDSFIIAKYLGLAVLAVYGLAQYAANLIQVPQRTIQSISAGVLSRFWKDKDMKAIERIYQKSCINLLLVALFIFGNLWLNASAGIEVLHLQQEYKTSIAVIFILGIVRIVDAGTGLNNTVINTSSYWKFDFYSGVVLLTMRLPLTFLLVKTNGIIGAAVAELIAFGIYNLIRFEFLRRKFQMQPIHANNVWAIVVAVCSLLICHEMFHQLKGWTGIIIRLAAYSTLFSVVIYYFKISSDVVQIAESILKKLKGHI